MRRETSGAAGNGLYTKIKQWRRGHRPGHYDQLPAPAPQASA
jgi:hypothetical protein